MTDEFKSGNIYSVGDTFTMAGLYKRRSLWQWITRQPKHLKVYTVTGGSTNPGACLMYE